MENRQFKYFFKFKFADYEHFAKFFFNFLSEAQRNPRNKFLARKDCIEYKPWIKAAAIRNLMLLDVSTNISLVYRLDLQ